MLSEPTQQSATSSSTAEAGSDIFFPVSLRPAEVDGQRVPGFVAVQRQDTGRVFAFHKEGYRLVSNAEVFPAFEAALQQSGLDLGDMTVQDALSHDGARTVRQYRLPRHQSAIQVGDTVSLQLKVVNSYDGALAFSSLLSGQRLVCLNGLVIAERFAQSYGRHTKGFAIAAAAEKLNRTLTVFEDQVGAWRAWAGKTLSDQQAQAVFAELTNANTRLLQRLQDYWQKEKETLGTTVWALFNALTYWSTHQAVRARSRDNLASIVLQREAQVRTLLNSTTFRQLAA